jgi:hypothetical protein
LGAGEQLQADLEITSIPMALTQDVVKHMPICQTNQGQVMGPEDCRKPPPRTWLQR